ncbi:erythromycin biosynthesis sensory transduction protein eryC1 [Alkalilimnicola ehrlichii]|uniref:Erythromycin biosynthesis sensory transduction protein eryC1 n=1 Tax=Alkalilimnicola ehrlichii TaxID=351052 RepID=A0A3E0WJG4_9GAMM|nr:DegT/DnrJ/EryC1/StrS family aminotransferase [Alkalilimnicola ehrlichii]RFA25862.1 erythromycin biosynthesis sensory transduction protein eryC1 [Alkalilimnicola ehrlichii]RFA33084.1 erythromycin biosynthesis sensory transduction protein eryC1 [Alkalilimnicola ehrlichii]
MSAISNSIPIYDPSAQDRPLANALQDAIMRVLHSGAYVLGQEVAAFEDAIASYLGVRHAIGVNSGTDALIIGLAALDVGPGDEVITSPFTFFGTAEAISRLGAEPRFVDIDPTTFNLDVGQVEAAINERTRCLLPVHLYGQAVDMSALKTIAARHGLSIVEDVAQAFGCSHNGARLGSLGDIGAFSFYPTKNLGGFGDGGMITTQRDDLADRCRRLRDHANRGGGLHDEIGFNSRLDAMQAALLRVKLPHIEEWNDLRRKVAARYSSWLQHEPGLRLPYAATAESHVFHQYTVRVGYGHRDSVIQTLRKAGINAGIYYPLPLHRQPPYRHQRATLPAAEAAADEVLSLPIWPNMPEATQERVVRTLTEALDRVELSAGQAAAS